MWRKSRVWWLPILAMLAFSPGCMRVVRQQAPYYIEGPHQIDPPNGYLDVGSHVLVFGKKESYCRVLTFKGIAAHVWSGALATPSEWREEQRAAKAAEMK